MLGCIYGARKTTPTPIFPDIFPSCVLTSQITSGKKQSEERTALFGVRAHLPYLDHKVAHIYAKFPFKECYGLWLSIKGSTHVCGGVEAYL
ncbi:MAG: hypothetical protein BMS9Abin22_114 [Gammaproteobacteria bacterium]|nr:MAG: hypothetical protein BMS9Abin22_114 [Gammaproteobacteria bacterium]